MKERVKSLLLAFLVLLSLVLTYRLWYGQKTVEEINEDGYERVFFEEPRPLAQVITPRQILVHREGLSYRLREGEPDFRALWGGISGVLQERFYLDNRADDQVSAGSQPCLTLEFNPFLPVGPGSPWLKEAPYQELERIELRRLEEQFWIVTRESGSGADVVLKLPGEQGELLKGLLDGLPPAERIPYRPLTFGELGLELNVKINAADGIYVPDGEVSMDELILKQENLDQELLVKTFFVNRSLVRVIEERDGALIYTDGEKGLRLSRGLEYSHPQLEREPVTFAYLAALNTSSRLLGYYGGWPEALRLESLSRNENALQQVTYRAQWRCYYEGYPILGIADATMLFNDGGLVEYRRSLYEPLNLSGNSLAVKSYREALEAAVNYLGEVKGIDETMVLEELSLAYRYNGSSFQPRAVPVWVIRLNGIELLFKASDLTLQEEVAP